MAAVAQHARMVITGLLCVYGELFLGKEVFFRNMIGLQWQMLANICKHVQTCF